MNLMPNAGLELKEKDPRYKRFVELYGKDQQAYEVDSLASHLLRQRIMNQLGLYVDLDEFAQVKALEQAVNSLFTDELKGTLDDLTKAILAGGVQSDGLTLPYDRQLLYLRDPDKEDETEAPGEEDEEIDEEIDGEEDEDDDE
jgi:hypothetical protein